MPKKKVSVKRVASKAKVTPWLKLYKFALGGVVAMTIVAIGAMVWQYYDIQSKMWMYDDYEEPALSSEMSDINLIELEYKNRIPQCGVGDGTKGACKTMKLSVVSPGVEGTCQDKNPAAAAAAGVTEAGCRMMAVTMQSWRGAFLSEACQPGLLYDQKTISSEWAVLDPSHTDPSTLQHKSNVRVAGMHKCTPGLAGRLCRDKSGKWTTCITAPYKAACKYKTEAPFNVEENGVLYKYCAPTDQIAPEDGTACYTGSGSKPTFKVCCPVGMVISGNVCALPQ